MVEITFNNTQINHNINKGVVKNKISNARCFIRRFSRGEGKMNGLMVKQMVL